MVPEVSNLTEPPPDGPSALHGERRSGWRTRRTDTITARTTTATPSPRTRNPAPSKMNALVNPAKAELRLTTRSLNRGRPPARWVP